MKFAQKFFLRIREGCLKTNSFAENDKKYIVIVKNKSIFFVVYVSKFSK